MCAHVNKLHEPRNNPEEQDKVRESVKYIATAELGATANNSRFLERDQEHLHGLRKYIRSQGKYFAHTHKLLWWNTMGTCSTSSLCFPFRLAFQMWLIVLHYLQTFSEY